jgi:hypothetical protein
MKKEILYRNILPGFFYLFVTWFLIQEVAIKLGNMLGIIK